jgi:hypothetical protein
MMFQTLHRMTASAGALKIRCAQCGHAVAWPRAEALRRLGSDATPADLRRRLRCGACGEKVQLEVWT